MELDDIDAGSLRLIVHLQLEEAESLIKAKQPKGAAPKTDGDLAFTTYQNDLRALLVNKSDRLACLAMRQPQQRREALAAGTRPVQQPDPTPPQPITRAVAIQDTTTQPVTSRPLQASAERPVAASEACSTSQKASDPKDSSTAQETNKTVSSTLKDTDISSGSIQTAIIGQEKASKTTKVEAISSRQKENEARAKNEETDTIAEKVDEAISSHGEAATSKHQLQEVVDAEGPAVPCKCIACGDSVDFRDIAQVACWHDYCRDCLGSLFLASTGDETLFPPRCCRQPIPLNSVKRFLPADIVAAFSAKEEELSTADRTYCQEKTCSAFIAKCNIEAEAAECPDCKKKTCTICKGSSHDGDCPKDAAVEEVLELAKIKGWQRCKTCRRMVELNTGCFHITCLCGAQFCYVCGERWKTCACRHWDERMLHARAANIVDQAARNEARLGGPAMDEATRQARIQQEAENARQHHECNHLTWDFRRGAGNCEECDYWAPTFLFRCRRCHISLCRMCKDNRL